MGTGAGFVSAVCTGAVVCASGAEALWHELSAIENAQIKEAGRTLVISNP